MRFIKFVSLSLYIVCGLTLCSTQAFGAPLLITQPGSTRALALESPSMTGEPFAPTVKLPFGLDPRTRIMLFATNMVTPVPPGSDAYIRIEAEDAGHRRFDLPIERHYLLDEFPDIRVIIVRLEMGTSARGDWLIQLFWQGVGSNRARIGIGHIGGGPAGANCPPSNIVFDGNSLTASMGATQPVKEHPFSTAYPAVSMNQLGCGYDYQNFAVVGQTTQEMSADAATQIDSQIKPGVRNVVVAWEGSNAMAVYGNATPQEAYEQLASYCRGRRAAGYKVILLTVLPRTDIWVLSDFEGKRQTLNTLLRNNYREFADALVDIGSDPQIGKPGDSKNLLYYTADFVHLTDAGYAIVANSVSQALAELP